jgi:hypothetical protein
MTDMRNLPVGQINDLANAFSLASSRGGRSTAVSRDGEASWFETHGDNRALTNEGQTLPANQIYSAAICRGAGSRIRMIRIPPPPTEPAYICLSRSQLSSGVRSHGTWTGSILSVL